jgi:hypothetical protein
MKRIPLKAAPEHGQQYALVDDEDYDKLVVHQWSLMAKPNSDIRYAYSRYEGKTWMMHRVITGAEEEQSVDHSDRNGLNNQKSNLRVCSHAENMRNRNMPRKDDKSSIYKGVYFRHNLIDKPWITQVQCRNNGVKHILYRGRFSTELEAARAYDLKAKEHFGEFARLNFNENAHQKS